MSGAPSFDAIFEVMAAASIGDATARVEVPEQADFEEGRARIALALNVLLDDLAARGEATTRMTERLEVLLKASRAFSQESSNPERLLPLVVRTLAECIDGTCTMYLLSADSQEIAEVYSHSADPRVRDPMDAFTARRKLDEHRIVKRVVQTGEPVLLAGAEVERGSAHPSGDVSSALERLDARTCLVVPLRVQGRAIGTLGCARHGADATLFGPEDLLFASGFADHAALAIANARAQAEARASEAHYRLMFEISPLPMWMYDLETLRFLDVNGAAVLAYGYSRDEFLAMTIKDIRPAEDIPALLHFIGSGIEAQATKSGLWRHTKRGGTVIHVEVTTHTFEVDGRNCRLAIARDITERAQLEEQLRQSQKMEAVGRLAGGIAHDFNNILSVILGHTDLLLSDTHAPDPALDDLEEIRLAAKRAADLTRQLLLFSRQQVAEQRLVNPNEVLVGLEKMLRRLVGEDVEVVTVTDPLLGVVRADPGSVEQVIMNLVVNARDAMPTGGRLTLETANVVLDEAYARMHLGVQPGSYVMLAVSDTGTGMDRTTQARIFEPFFTTKAHGKGTGLGLATVFGVAQQTGGNVWVSSEPGKGSTFKVYLPRSVETRANETAPALPPSTPAPTTRGHETILLVEDEDQVRAIAHAILRRGGYRVIEARLAADALRISAEHPDRIHLLLTDVVMPQLSGPELARRLAPLRPDMRVLCMSGYTDDSVVRHGVLDSRIAFLQKPFTPDTLTRRVRDVLDGAAPYGAKGTARDQVKVKPE